MPASSAATIARSMRPVRGSGSIVAVTTASWLAFATTTRSTGSESSAVRRSVELRSSRRTMRPWVSVSPETSPTMSTWSPTTIPLRPSSRALIAYTSVPSSSSTVNRPRSTVMTVPDRASACSGRSLDRGRDLPRPGRTRTSSSSRRWCLRVTRWAPCFRSGRSSRASGAGTRGGSCRSSRCPRPRRRERAGRRWRRRWPCGGRRRCGTSRACSGRGSMTRPSAVSVTSPPRPLSSVASAARRSVSCPRRWAMPLKRDGVLASAARAARVGASSPTSDRSASMPVMAPPPVTVSPSASSRTSAPMRARRSRSASPAWVVATGQSGTVTRPPVTRAAARKGAALERSGSMWRSSAGSVVGVDVPDRVAVRSGPGCRARPASRSSCRCAACSESGRRRGGW